MRKTIVRLSLYALAVLVCTPCIRGQVTLSDPHDYLIYFHPSTPKSTINDIRSQMNSVEVAVTPLSGIRLWRVISYPFTIPGSPDPINDINEVVETLEDLAEVSGLGNEYFTEVVPKESGPPANPNYDYISCASGVQNFIEMGSRSIRISIFDTGLTVPTNPQATPFTFEYGQFSGYDYVNDDDNPSDDHGHGTHVTGIISHIAQHLSYQNQGSPVEIYFDIRKTHNELGEGLLSDIVFAIDDAILSGSHVMNMSFSYRAERDSDKQHPLEIAIQTAASYGVLVIASAGNNGLNNDLDTYPAYPASFDANNIISAASVNCGQELSWFSNWGSESVDLAAPGENIPGPDTTGHVVMKSGTSQSAAILSGIAVALGTHMTQFHWQPVKCAMINGAEQSLGLHGLISAEGVGNAPASLPLLTVCGSGAGHPTSLGPTKQFGTTNADWVISPVSNPVVDALALRMNTPRDMRVEVRLLTLSGQELDRQWLVLKEGSHHIELPALATQPSGIYLVDVRSTEAQQVLKVMKSAIR